LVRIIGLKNHARVNLKIEEPEGGSRKKESAPAEEKSAEPVADEFDDFKI
jgi:hypothetical protein